MLINNIKLSGIFAFNVFTCYACIDHLNIAVCYPFLAMNVLYFLVISYAAINEPRFRKGGRSEAQKSPPDMAKHSDDRRWRSRSYDEEEGTSRAIDGGNFQAALDHTCEIWDEYNGKTNRLNYGISSITIIFINILLFLNLSYYYNHIAISFAIFLNSFVLSIVILQVIIDHREIGKK